MQLTRSQDADSAKAEAATESTDESLDWIATPIWISFIYENEDGDPISVPRIPTISSKVAETRTVGALQEFVHTHEVFEMFSRVYSNGIIASMTEAWLTFGSEFAGDIDIQGDPNNTIWQKDIVEDWKRDHILQRATRPTIHVLMRRDAIVARRQPAEEHTVDRTEL